jgi:hypothetical protein
MQHFYQQFARAVRGRDSGPFPELTQSKRHGA